jgi:hypothetical protein
MNRDQWTLGLLAGLKVAGREFGGTKGSALTERIAPHPIFSLVKRRLGTCAVLGGLSLSDHQSNAASPGGLYQNRP